MSGTTGAAPPEALTFVSESWRSPTALLPVLATSCQERHRPLALPFWRRDVPAPAALTACSLSWVALPICVRASGAQEDPQAGSIATEGVQATLTGQGTPPS